MYNRVKEARVDKQIKQEVLAYEAGIARSTLSMIETGVHIPKVDTAIRIARALNTIVEDLWIIRPSDAASGTCRGRKGDSRRDIFPRFIRQELRN